jgi:hypothetical protein
MNLFTEILKTLVILVTLLFLSYKVATLSKQISRMNNCLCLSDSQCENFDYD